MRNDKEFEEILELFKKAIRKEFQKDLPLSEFVPALIKERNERLEFVVQNRLGHLRNYDFDRLVEIILNLVSEENNPTSKEEVILNPITNQEIKPRGRPKKS